MLCLHDASLSPLCGFGFVFFFFFVVFSSSVLNLAELSSSVPAVSVGQFGSLYSVFL